MALDLMFFSLSDGSRIGKNVIMFRVDNTALAHINKKGYLNFW